MSTKFDKVIDDLANEVYDRVDDLAWLQTQSSYLVHEMMHTRLIDNSPPDPHSKLTRFTSQSL